MPTCLLLSADQSVGPSLARTLLMILLLTTINGSDSHSKASDSTPIRETMSQSFSAFIPYHSAYRGPIFSPDGTFDHFARRCDEAHLQNGYWKFAAIDDDRRAYERGMDKPEDVLRAQDVRDGAHDDIMLRWVPGKLDETNSKPLVGTAAAHLETIYNERKLLGMSLSFQGRVPIYPISKDTKLTNYRLTRYGIQKGILPETTLLSPVRHDVQSVGDTSPSLLNERLLNHPTDPVTVLAPALSPPQPASGTTMSHQVASTALHAPSDSTPAFSSPLILLEDIGKPVDRLEPAEDMQNPLSQQSFRSVPMLDIDIRQSALLTEVRFSSSNGSFEQLTTMGLSEARVNEYADVADGICGVHARETPSESSIDDVSVLSLADQSYSEFSSAQSAILPCMDCGSSTSHTSQCWIDKVALSLRPVEELSVLQLCELAESVARFDPGPWTSHTRIPQEPLDDPKTQIKELADAIRNLDIFSQHPGLHGLDDQLTVLSWVFLSPGNVDLLRGSDSTSRLN